MARYSDDTRERVRDAADFVALVGAHTELRKAGARSYEGRCPFHDERTPSFGIDPVEKLYHCFGCGAGGDVFKFVMETENLGFGEALEWLAQRTGVTLEPVTDDPAAARERSRRERLLALLERTAAFYVRMLWEHPEAAGARAYLDERGFGEETLKAFRVGYSPAAWDRVVRGSQAAGYGAEELLATGLAQRSRGRGEVIDRFRGRLMFPWADPRGRVLGFGARALSAEARPKYLNTGDGELFHKGRLLYGADRARAPAAKAGSIVLVEGYTDVLALHQAGLTNVVGSMGTAVTGAQGAELAKLAPTVQLAFDADAAGQAAMVKAAAALGGADARLSLRVVPLPPGSDPADLVARDGAEATAALIERSVPFVRWQVEQAVATGDLSSAEGRDAVLDAVGRPIRELRPSVLRDELVQHVAGALGLSESLTASTLSAARPAAASSRGGAEPARGAAAGAWGRRAEAELAFLAFCVALPASGAPRLADPAVEGLFAVAELRRAAAHLRDHLGAPSAGIPSGDTELAALIAQIVVRAGGLVDPQPAQLDKLALLLRRAQLDRAIAAARANPAGARRSVTDLSADRARIDMELRSLPS